MNAFERFAERLIFGYRPVVLFLFAAITVAMVFFASQLKVDPGFKPGTKEQFDTIRGNIIKANILGRLVAKDWSGAMVWADIIPESKTHKVDYQKIAKQLEAIRKKYEHGNITVHIIGFSKMV